MRDIVGEPRRFLEVDLGRRSGSIFIPSDRDFADYLGGKGLALKLIADRFSERAGRDWRAIDPLGPDNILAFATGVFIGTGAPCSARFAGASKSPLTGIMTTCSCGGPFGMALRTAGFDGLLVSGRAERPTVLRIDERGATFEDADDLWGMETGAAQARLASDPADGALVIGPAGENGVLYANIRSGNRYLGRGGMGAVMGAKNLKAVVARGKSCRVVPADQERFARLNKKAKEHIVRNSFVREYKAYGTNYNVNFGVDAGFAPVRNFRDRTDERCRNLSGQAMAERYATKHSVCVPCSVLCGHKGVYPDGRERHIPEYETIGLWGGNIMNFDPDPVGDWNDRMNELGMDTISAGGTVAWAMEASEKGIRPSELAFGKIDNIARTIDDIAFLRGEGAELALGSKRLAERHGGLEFAAQVKGMEMAAYDPRAAWGQGLNYAVANRGGCHLSAYPIALESMFKFIPPYTTRSKAEWVDFMEDFYAAVNSAQTCQFSSFGYLLEPFVAKYTPKPFLKLAMTFMPRVAQALLDWSVLSGLVSAITGRRVTPGDFKRIGRRVHVLERCMNMRMGAESHDDTLPARFLDEADTAHRVRSVVPVAKLVRKYYRAKKYDRHGRPTPALLRSLGIDPGMAPDETPRLSLHPRPRPLPTLYARVALALVGKAFAAAHRVDPVVRRELSRLGPGGVFALRVHPSGPGAALRLGADEKLRYLGYGPAKPDVLMCFANLGAALKVLTFRANALEVYAKNGFTVSGDLPTTMAVIRALGVVETLLLPRFVARKVLKRPHRFGFLRGALERLAVYCLLPFMRRHRSAGAADKR